MESQVCAEIQNYEAIKEGPQTEGYHTEDQFLSGKHRPGSISEPSFLLSHGIIFLLLCLRERSHNLS